MDPLVHVIIDSGMTCEEMMLIDSLTKGRAAIYFSKAWLKYVLSGDCKYECDEIRVRIYKKMLKRLSSELYVIEHQDAISNDDLMFSFAQKLAVIHPEYKVVFIDPYSYFEEIADGIGNLKVMSFPMFANKYSKD